jgi:hypothetical protein
MHNCSTASKGFIMQYCSVVASLTKFAVQAWLLLQLVASAQAATLGTPPVPITSCNWTLGRGDTLTLNVPLAQIKDATHDPTKLVLILNGRMLKTLHPSMVNSAEQRISFDIIRNAADAEAWMALLGQPDMAFTKTWKASIGYEDLGPISTSAPFGFMIIRAWAFWTGVVGFAICFILLVRLARTSDMLRDPNGYFSLGRTQMAIWFVLVIAAFVFIWGITADYKLRGDADA